MRKQLISSLLVLALMGVSGVFSSAQAYGTLWVGNDTNSQQPILNVDLTGTVLRTIANVPATGFAVDSGSGTLYVNENLGMQRLLTFSLGTLTPGADLPLSSSVGEDMSFDGTSILAFNNSTGGIDRINPANGQITSSIPVPVANSSLGLSWDGGSGVWVSPFNNTGTLYHFDTFGNLLSSFVAIPNDFAGGIAYDSDDGTLFVGGFGGVVTHFSTAGALLGSFTIPNRTAFIDGLEFEQVPEPATLALLALGLAGIGFSRRKQ